MDTTAAAAKLADPATVEEAAVDGLAAMIGTSPPVDRDVDWRICPVCHAGVAYGHAGRHAQWHINLRKSLRSGSGLLGAFNAGLALHPPVI